MRRWTCPACGREFGREGQSHVCSPAMSVDQYFAERSADWRPIFDAVASAVAEFGPVITEPVSSGILFKRRGTFAGLQPRRTGMQLGFASPGRLVHNRITRTRRVRISRASDRWWHGTLITSPEQVDELVREWLARAYDASN